MSGTMSNSRQKLNTDKLQELINETKDLQDCFELFD